MGRPSVQALTRLLGRIERIRRADDESIVVGVIAHRQKPMKRTGLDGDVCAASSGAVGEELLFDAGGPSFAGFRLQRRVAEVAEIVAKDLVEARLLDALAVENAVEGIAPNSLAITQSQGCSGARNNPRSEIGVGFGATPKIERKARKRPVAEIQEAGLIVAASVADVNRGKEGVLDFVLIAGGDAEIGEEIAGLSAHIRAVVFEAAIADEIAEFRARDGRGIGLGAEGIGVRSEKTLPRIEVVLASVRLSAADFVAPALAGGKIPAGASAENVLIITLKEARWFEHGLSWNAGGTVVVAKSEAELIGGAEAVTEIAGKRAVQKIIVRPLAVGLQVGGRRRIVKRSEHTADLCATTARGKIAALTESAELRNARGAAVSEELDDARNRIGAVDGAFCATNDFDLVDVVEREAGKIDSATGRIDGCTIYEDFGEVGIAAVEKNGSCSTLGPGAADGNSGRKKESFRQRDGLTRVKLFLRDGRDRSSGLIDKRGFSLCGDDHASGETLESEIQIEPALLIGGQVENEIATDEWGAVEGNMIAARRNGKGKGAIAGRVCFPDGSSCIAFQLRCDMHPADARSAGVQKSAKQMSIRRVVLCACGKAEYRNCDEKKGSTKKRRFHFVL